MFQGDFRETDGFRDAESLMQEKYEKRRHDDRPIIIASFEPDDMIVVEGVSRTLAEWLMHAFSSMGYNNGLRIQVMTTSKGYDYSDMRTVNYRKSGDGYVRVVKTKTEWIKEALRVHVDQYRTLYIDIDGWECDKGKEIGFDDPLPDRKESNDDVETTVSELAM